MLRRGAVVVLFVLVASRVASGGSTECESIRDPDQRHFCRAVTTRSASWCEFIRASDLRHECRAVVASLKGP